MRPNPERSLLAAIAAGAFCVACSDSPGNTVDAGADVADSVAEAGDSDTSPDENVATDDTPADDHDTEVDGSGDADDTTSEPPHFVTADEALALVDPFIGSGGIGFGYASLTPAAQLPLGLVKVGPDTTVGGSHSPLNHFSGYYHGDTDTRGFSHIRLVGTGAADLGCLRILPASTTSATPWRQYAALDKASERAVPGAYTVTLPAEGVDVALAPGLFSALHTYTFRGEQARVIINPSASITDEATTLSTIAVDGNIVHGSVEFRGGFTGRQRGFTLYFDIELSEPPVASSAWAGGDPATGASATGSRAGLVLDYGAVADRGERFTLEVRVGLSLIDADAARRHRVAELEGRGHADVAGAASAAWRERLSHVRIAGGTERQRRMFYTALYNAYRMPTRLTELDGRYVGHDLQTHTEPSLYVSDLSLWDTYRTLHPWYSLTDHETQRASVQSLLAMAAQSGGPVPRWPSMLGDTGSMIGSSADIVLGDAAAKGVDGVDWGVAFDVLHDSAYRGGGRSGIDDYVTLGYLSADRHGSSVSRTLEYMWNDFGLATVADAAGRTDEAAALRASARAYDRLFDASVQLFMPRTAAGFLPDVDPRSVFMGDGPFTEGSAWHWAFYFFHDPSVMVAAIGEDGVLTMLDTFFERSPLGRSAPISHAIPNSYYWHGNEPTIHAAWLYHAVGEPNRGNRWIRQIQERLYDDTPAGLPGNDDGGTMSSWYLFAAIGLYPVAGSDLYYVSAPLFERVEIDLPGGEQLRIEAPGASAERYVARSVAIDGDDVGTSVTHAQLPGATIIHDLAASDAP